MSALARTSESDCRTRTTGENCTASESWTRTKYGYDDGTSEPGYSFPPECFYYDDGMIPTSAQLTPPTSPTTSPSPGLDVSALIAGAAQNRRNCLKNAAQKRIASRFNALNTRAGEFNKHFTRVQME